MDAQARVTAARVTQLVMMIMTTTRRPPYCLPRRPWLREDEESKCEGGVCVGAFIDFDVDLLSWSSSARHATSGARLRGNRRCTMPPVGSPLLLLLHTSFRSYPSLILNQSIP